MDVDDKECLSQGKAMPHAVMELLLLAEAPDSELLAAVQRHGGRRTIDAVFDHAVEVQEHDPEAALRHVVLINRIRVVLCHAYLDRSTPLA